MLTSPFKYAMKIGKLFTGEEIKEDVFIVIDHGKISEISESWKGTYVDFSDFYATPGYIDANTFLGIRSHLVEYSHPYSPEFSCHQVLSLNAYSPHSPDVKLAREFGVTSAFISVPNANPISGFGVAVKTVEGRRRDALYPESLHLKVSLGARYAEGGISLGEEEVACKVREFFKGHKDEIGKGMLRGRVFFYVKEEEEIETALEICEDFELKGAIVGPCPSRFASYLKDLDVHVIFSPFWGRVPHSSFEYLDFKEAAKLIRYKVKISLSTFHPTLDVRFLQLAPILSVRYGISEIDALKTVTINPAETLGIGERVGKIAPGYDADLVIWEGSPFHFSSRIKEIYVRGIRVPRKPETDEDRDCGLRISPLMLFSLIIPFKFIHMT